MNWNTNDWEVPALIPEPGVYVGVVGGKLVTVEIKGIVSV